MTNILEMPTRKTTTTTQPTIDVARVTNHLWLVDLDVSFPTRHKRDKRATSHVKSHFRTDNDAGNFNKKLWTSEIKAIGKHPQDFRNNFFDKLTVQGFGSNRICLRTDQQTLLKEIRPYQRKWEQAIEDFLSRYYEIVSRNVRRLGDIGSYADYPTREQVRRKFGFAIRFLPFPLVHHNPYLQASTRAMEQTMADSQRHVESVLYEASESVTL